MREKEWTVEMCYALNVTVRGNRADTREEAIEKAKQKVEEEVRILSGNDVDCGYPEYDQTTYVQQEG